MVLLSQLVKMAHMDIGGRFNLSNKILSNEPSFGFFCAHATAYSESSRIYSGKKPSTICSAGTPLFTSSWAICNSVQFCWIQILSPLISRCIKVEFTNFSPFSQPCTMTLMRFQFNCSFFTAECHRVHTEFAQSFLVLRSLPPAVAGVRAPGKSCLSSSLMLGIDNE